LQSQGDHRLEIVLAKGLAEVVRSAAGLIFVGSISQIYLIGFSVVAVLLLGVRVGLGAALLSSVSLFAVGALGERRRT
jgi:hypothetical protein